MTEGGATRYHLVDLHHQGRPESVAACVLETADGLLVVDPGPASTLPQLSAGLSRRGSSLADIRGLLLTHIHLDHAGGAGTLARAHPRLRVYVHEKGAPHLIDPSRLLASASRLYGDRMDRLWGEVAAIPAEQVVVLHGGEQLRLGGRQLEVLHTPGHAWHHVSYLEGDGSLAFVGDTAGLRTPGLPWVLPVTPPPDFDLEAWIDSIDRLLARAPSTLVLTHFGPSEDPVRHLEQLREGLLSWSAFARDSLTQPGDDSERLAWFIARLEEWIADKVEPERAAGFLAGAGPEACWHGLVRYWTRRGVTAG
jgi:glyoxylase-like metal-dependent hydrolase (beta-lactamase superfamily II)